MIDELNVKAVIVGGELALDLELTDELRSEGLMREIVRQVQSARKEAGLNVDDRIQLSLTSDDETLQNAYGAHVKVIKDETLAVELSDNAEYAFSKTVTVDGASLVVCLQKAV